MPREARRPKRLRRSSSSVLVILGAITVSSAVSLGVLGWNLLKQDAELAASRDRVRLDLDADRLVQEFQRLFADVGSKLTTVLENPAITGQTVPTFGIYLVMTPAGIAAIPPQRLLFHPVLPPRREPAEALFAEGERAEFRLSDFDRAADAYRQLAESADPAIRAAALMRLGRVHRSTGQLKSARTAFEQMASMSGATVFDRPADLVAQIELTRLLLQSKRRQEAQTEARGILNDLASGRWILTRGQYESIVEDVAGISDQPVPQFQGAVMSSTAGHVWTQWRAGSVPNGARLVRSSGAPILAVVRGSSERAVTWLAEPVALLSQLKLDSSLAFTLTDGESVVGSTTAPVNATPVVRADVDTRLPWTMHISRSGGSADNMPSRMFVTSGLALVVVFLAAGAFFIGRAIKRESDLARAQSDFVAAVSHEFRTPLAAMRQFSELLAAGRVQTEEKRQHYYESLAGESRRLQKLVENLLNLGRLEAGAKPFHLEPTDLRDLVRHVVNDYRSQLSRPDCQIDIDDAGGTTVVRADREAIALALHNLLDNAVKYSGGDRPVRVAWAVRGDQVALSVQDDGPGISIEEQPRIFERFVRGAAAETANIRGTGIGLAMVKLVATGHGGDVVVESRPGDGATFTMLLPAERTT